MKETYQQVTTENGQSYMMLTNEDTDLKSDLPWKGRVLYDMIKEQQPERFLQMKQSKELIPFLQKITAKYYDQMDKHIIDNGMMEIEADEMEWPQLTKAAGLI
jgi:lysyl-tRNA synthetase class II